MVSEKTFLKLVLSFDETSEQPHFGNTSFWIKKKIFATLNSKMNRIAVKFSLVDQSVFCAFDKEVIFPVDSKWSRHGWTNINLKKVKKEMLMDALTAAYCEVAPPKLAAKYIPAIED